MHPILNLKNVPPLVISAPLLRNPGDVTGDFTDKLIANRTELEIRKLMKRFAQDISGHMEISQHAVTGVIKWP